MQKIRKYFWQFRFNCALLNQKWFHGLQSFHYSVWSGLESDKEYADVYQELYLTLVDKSEGVPVSELDL